MTHPEFVKKFNLIFSSLSERKLQHLTTNKSDTLILSNIKPHRVECYAKDIEDFISIVTIVDEEFLTYFYKQFPILKRYNCYLDAGVLCKYVKITKGIEAEKTTIVRNKRQAELLIVTYNKKGEEAARASCGEISDMKVEAYDNIARSTYFTEGTKIDNKQYNLAENIREVKLDDVTIRVMYLSGRSIVSRKEFIKKSKYKDEEYEYYSLFKKDNNSYQMINVLECPLVEVHNIQPAMIWYVPLHKEHQSITH